MVNAAFRRRAVPDCCLERRHGDARVHRPADRVADHLARPGIQNGRQINEATRDGHIRQVCDPELVGAVGNDILGQVGVDWPAMVAVRRHHEATPPLGLQIVLAHQATELFAVHHHALMAQRRPDPAIAIALELVADRVDPGQQVLSIQRRGCGVVKGRAGQFHQLAPPGDGKAGGPVTTEAVALLGRGACFKAPLYLAVVGGNQAGEAIGGREPAAP